MCSYWIKYILVAVDYVLKWVEAIALPNIEGKSIIAFLKKNIFSRFVHLGPLLVMEACTFVIYCSNVYWKNKVFVIMWLLLTTHRLARKLRCPIGRSNRQKM